MIELTDVCLQYAGAPLHHINLRVAPGEMVAVLGDAASRRSFLRALGGFIPHLRAGNLTGEMRVAGLDLRRASLQERLGAVGLLSGDPSSQLSGVCASVEAEIA